MHKKTSDLPVIIFGMGNDLMAQCYYEECSNAFKEWVSCYLLNTVHSTFYLVGLQATFDHKRDKDALSRAQSLIPHTIPAGPCLTIWELYCSCLSFSSSEVKTESFSRVQLKELSPTGFLSVPNC